MRTGLLRLGLKEESLGTTVDYCSDGCPQLPLVVQQTNVRNSFSIWCLDSEMEFSVLFKAKLYRNVFIVFLVSTWVTQPIIIIRSALRGSSISNEVIWDLTAVKQYQDFSALAASGPFKIRISTQLGTSSLHPRHILWHMIKSRFGPQPLEK